MAFFGMLYASRITLFHGRVIVGPASKNSEDFMKIKWIQYASLFLVILCRPQLTNGSVPPLLNFQGRIVIGGISYNGTGQFRFALVDGTGTETNAFWSNDGTSSNEPSLSISLALTNGLYAVLLGDTNVSGMTQPLTASIFTNADVRLRVWFNDGTHGFEKLTPDQRIVSAGYALVADTANNFAGTISPTQLPADIATTDYVTNTVQTAVNAVLASGTDAATPYTYVRRDGTASFQATNITLQGDLNLPATAGACSGVIYAGGNSLIQEIGTDNFFAGQSAGNFTLTGINNAGIGTMALNADTSGGWNTAVGSYALFSNTSGYENAAIGYNALESNSTGNDNTAVGNIALFNNTSGYENIAIGDSALFSNTNGTFNSAYGCNALYSNSSGSENVAIGDYSLFGNTTGYNNIGIGPDTLQANTTGNDNTAAGNDALLSNTNGTFNSAFGSGALYSNSSGNDNVAIGDSSLNNNMTGNDNVGVGPSALYSDTSGNNNIAVGYEAGFNITTGGYNIDIGNNGVSDDTNVIRIGTSQASTYIGGIYGVTSGSGLAVYINSNGQLGTTTSSRRFKEDIQDIGDESDELMQLRPVSFFYKREYDSDPQRVRQYGLIAEEVDQIDPNLVVHETNGAPFTVRYNLVNALLLNEVQKQHKTILAQATDIQLLKEQNDALSSRLNTLEQTMQTLILKHP